MNYQTAKIQASIVKIKTVHWRLSVAAIYSPPRHSLSTGEYKDFFQTVGNRFLVGETGTPNIHTGSPDWLQRKGETYGVLWATTTTITSVTLQLHTGRPTDPRKLPDLLDFFVSHGLPRNKYQIHSNFDLSSDRAPAIAILSTAAINKPNPP